MRASDALRTSSRDDLFRACAEGAADEQASAVPFDPSARGGRAYRIDDALELFSVDVGDHAMVHPTLQPVGDPIATLGCKLGLAVARGLGPDERVDDVIALPVDERGHRPAVEIVDAAADEH